MKQVNIFGEEVPVEKIVTTDNSSKGPIPIKTKFRSIHGFKEGFKCKNCKFLENRSYSYKNYYKCSKMGISGGPGTDIRLKDIACNLYEEANNVINK